MASVKDTIQQLDNHFVQVNFKGKAPRFEPTPRPGVAVPTSSRKGGRGKLNTEQNDTLFAHLQRTQGA